MKIDCHAQSKECKSRYIAKLAGDGREETVEQHSRNTALLAESYAPEMMKTSAAAENLCANVEFSCKTQQA